MFHFYTSLKRNKTSGFQIFLFVFFMGGGGGGIEMEHWPTMS